MTDYSVGLDLGQLQDYTAIPVVGLDEDYQAARHQRKEITARYASRPGSPHLERELSRVPLPDEPTYEAVHLERLALRTPYTEVARHVKRLMHTAPLKGNATLTVDATGVGVAVTDQLRAEGLTFKSVVITGGEKESREGLTYRVPKRNLIARPQVLLQEGNRRLKIASSLPEAKTLVDELLNYRYKITDAGNDTYSAWREGQHDDLVLALALAVWAAPSLTASIHSVSSSANNVFEAPREMPFKLGDSGKLR